MILRKTKRFATKIGFKPKKVSDEKTMIRDDFSNGRSDAGSVGCSVGGMVGRSDGRSVGSMVFLTDLVDHQWLTIFKTFSSTEISEISSAVPTHFLRLRE